MKSKFYTLTILLVPGVAFSQDASKSALALAKEARIRENEKETKSKVEAAILLNKISRMRLVNEGFNHTQCLTDLPKATKLAKDKDLPLVLWVGVTCEDHKKLRDTLGKSVNCHLKEFNNNTSKRVLISFPGKEEMFVFGFDKIEDNLENIKQLMKTKGEDNGK